MSIAEDTIKSRCHPSCRTCTGECLLLQQLNLNGLALAELKVAGRDGLIPFYCTDCGLCSVACNRKLSPARLMREWRAEAAMSEDGLPDALQPRLTDQPDHLFTQYRRAISGDIIFPEPAPAETVFFPGCAMSAYTPELALAAFDSLQARFPGLGWLDSCCYDLLDTLGLDERYARAQKLLATEVERYGVRRIITACPTCHYRLAQAFPDLQVVSIYTLLADERRTLSGLPARIAIHDSCADRMTQDLGRAVRSLLPPAEKLKHEGKRSLCCGAGGGVDFTNPGLSLETARRHWAEVEASGAQMLVTYCTRCAVQLAQTSSGIPVVHVLDLMFGQQPEYNRMAFKIHLLTESERG